MAVTCHLDLGLLRFCMLAECVCVCLCVGWVVVCHGPASFSCFSAFLVTSSDIKMKACEGAREYTFDQWPQLNVLELNCVDLIILAFTLLIPGPGC